MSVEEMIEDLLSKDPYRIWSVSSNIGKWSQDREKIEPFLPYYRAIKRAVSGIELGGMFAPNQRFIDKMFAILDHYKCGKGCACHLYGLIIILKFMPRKGISQFWKWFIIRIRLMWNIIKSVAVDADRFIE